MISTMRWDVNFLFKQRMKLLNGKQKLVEEWIFFLKYTNCYIIKHVVLVLGRDSINLYKNISEYFIDYEIINIIY